MTPSVFAARLLTALTLAAAGSLAWASDSPAPTESVPAGAAGAAALEATPPVGGSAASTPAATPAQTPPAADGPVVTTPAADASGVAPAPAPRPERIRLDPPRGSLLPLAQPLWSDLSPTQQRVLEPFAAQWNALPIDEKRAWADLARRFPKMKSEEQQRVERRVTEWAALTPEQRKLARANYRLAQQVAREGVLAEWENYQTMTPEQRTVLGTAGNTSNTAARHAGAATGLAKQAAQPLPRRAPAKAPVTAGTDGSTLPAAGVLPTVGPAGTQRP